MGEGQMSMHAEHVKGMPEMNDSLEVLLRVLSSKLKSQG